MDLKVLGAIGFGLIVSLMLGFFIIPTDLTIERAVLVDASPEEIYPHIVDLQQWDRWDPWQTQVQGTPTKGEGAGRTWARGGVLRVDDAEQDIRLMYTIEGAAVPTSGSLELLNDDEGTVVVWTHYTQTGYMPSDRLAGWAARSELALEMDEALGLLKADIEASP